MYPRWSAVTQFANLALKTTTGLDKKSCSLYFLGVPLGIENQKLGQKAIANAHVYVYVGEYLFKRLKYALWATIGKRNYWTLGNRRK